MSQRSSISRSVVIRRIAGGTCLTIVALILAHAANAFIVDAQHVSSATLSASPAVPERVQDIDTPDSQQQADMILQSGLFTLPPHFRSMKDRQPVVDEGPPPQPIEAARKVALLGGAFGHSGGTMAVLEDLTSKQQALYRLGAEVPNVGILIAIEKNRVLFRSGRSEEWLPLAITQRKPEEPAYSASAPPPPPMLTPPARRVLDRREVVAALGDPTRLMTHAQAVPYLTDGKLDGFRLYNVVPAGFYDKIGLRTNDLIQRINGTEIRDPGMLLSLLQQLRDERTVRIDMVRNTQRQTLTYEIR